MFVFYSEKQENWWFNRSVSEDVTVRKDVLYSVSSTTHSLLISNTCPPTQGNYECLFWMNIKSLIFYIILKVVEISGRRKKLFFERERERERERSVRLYGRCYIC